MPENSTKEEVLNSLRTFKNRRDALLHEDTVAFDHHLERFVAFCRTNALVQKILRPLQNQFDTDPDAWWQEASGPSNRIYFPDNADHEFVLRYRIIENLEDNPQRLYHLGIAQGMTNLDDRIGLFRVVVVRPFADELTHRLGQAADLAMPEARAMQTVPLHRIPSPREVKIFLSHKSVDKPLVYRYYHTLK